MRAGRHLRSGVRWLVATPVALAAALLVLTAAGVVLASESVQPEKVCVPAKGGRSVVTPKNGACKSGYALSETGAAPGGGTVGYSEYQVSPTPIAETPQFLDRKTLPAGSYLVTATVPITAQGEKGGSIGLECTLVDKEGPSTQYIDRARSYGPLTVGQESSPRYLYETTLALTGPLETASSSTVGLECDRFDNTAESETVNSSRMQLTVVQTSADE
jgi:hypothetical protein